MLNEAINIQASNPLKNHWDQTDKLIVNWLTQRQELIKLFCAVDGLQEYTPKHTPINVKVQAFCNTLIDYISAGHFELYNKLVDEAAQFQLDYSHFTRKILPLIQVSTQIAVDFNDKYSNGNLSDENQSLAVDLSYLGEALADRFDMEDRLIDAFHRRHRDLVA